MVAEKQERLSAAVIVNPSKVNDVEALRMSLTAAMTVAGWDCALWLETSVRDPGYGMAEQALSAGVTLVLACGGDGTMHAVLNVLAGSGTPLGVLATGSGNLLARNLGLPLNDPLAALAVALTGIDRPIDVGRLEPTRGSERPDRFAVMAGVGFDAAIMRDAPRKLKGQVGWPAYVVSAVRHLRDASMHAHVSIDQGEPLRVRARTIVIGNIGTLPGGLDLMPDARPDDGLLDVAVIAGHTLTDWLRVAVRIITRRADVDHRYSTHQGKQVRVTLRSTHARQVDGDVIASGRVLEVEIEAAALLVRVPPPQPTELLRKEHP